MSLKSGYVTTIRGLNALSRGTGLTRWLDARCDRSRSAHWARSLGAIHDLEGLVALDVPWWTYRAIDAVTDFLDARPGTRVFEYGSGASTIWLARRAGQVTSVEHHAGWHDRMVAALAARNDLCPVALQLVEPDATPASDRLYLSDKAGEKGQSFAAYARAIEGDPGALYDLIVIDGRARNACLAHAAAHLAPGGMIVFDNSARGRYARAISASDFTAQHLRGLTPTLPYPDQTTLLRRADGAA
jgi:predicted O-methyltransferase YrrM